MSLWQFLGWWAAVSLPVALAAGWVLRWGGAGDGAGGMAAASSPRGSFVMRIRSAGRGV